MLYSQLVNMRPYKMSKVLLPKGDTNGFGHVIFVVEPNQSRSIQLIRKNWIDYKTDKYAYYIDTKYYEKIGNKRVASNMTQQVKEGFDLGIDSDTGDESKLKSMKFIPFASKNTWFSAQKNCFVDLSIWMELFFKHRRITSTEVVCSSFMEFLGSKINDSFYDTYAHKYILFNIQDWLHYRGIQLDRKGLNNPISILLYSLYRYPELLKVLEGIEDIIITNRDSNQVMRISVKYLLTGSDSGDKSASSPKSIYSKLVKRLSMMEGVMEIGNTKEITNIEDPSVTIAENDVKDSAVAVKDPKKIAKIRIANAVKKNFLGDIEDITQELEAEPEPDEFSFDVDEPVSRVIQRNSPKIIDSDEEGDEEEELILDDPDLNDMIDEFTQNMINTSDEEGIDLNEENIDAIANTIRTDVIRNAFTKNRTKLEDDNILKLQKIQSEVLTEMRASEVQDTSIPASLVDNVVDAVNPTVTQLKFNNFDKAYAEKNMMADIDNAVAMLSEGSTKVFIIDKFEEDTSDSMNLKKTLTYTLKDENGVTMTLKFDIPIIIEGCYIFINGSKKMIGHQFMLKPITKVKPDTVIITTFYNKATITRTGRFEILTSSIKKYFNEDPERFNVKFGNSVIKNKQYLTTLEFDMIAKNIHEFTIGDYLFITEIDKLMEKFKSMTKNKDDDSLYRFDNAIYIPIAINNKTKELVLMNREENYALRIEGYMETEDVAAIHKMKVPSRMMYAQIKILQKEFPLIFFLLFCKGWTQTMKDAQIEWMYLEDLKATKSLDPYNWGIIKLETGYIAWKRNPLRNSMLMNGLVRIPLELFNMEELDSKDTYVNLCSQFFSYAAAAFNLDQFKDFMIDNVTKELLIKYGYPTDLCLLLIYAADLLTNNNFLPENDMNNMRVRSNELIAQFVYTNITKAYNQYRKTQYKKHPMKISMKQNQVISDLLQTAIVEDASSLNVVLQLEKSRAVTYKGPRGINKDRAMTLPKRGMTKSMIGTVGITTPNDANVGIMRQLTLEPNIVSTRGEIDPPKTDEDINAMSSVNLLTPAELLTPMGIIHDDPDRSSIAICCRG